MDPVTLVYYAAVCGTLGAASPWLGRLPVRLAVGAVVGLIAASLLPYIHQVVGYG
jgi:hypothetical protein